MHPQDRHYQVHYLQVSEDPNTGVDLSIEVVPDGLGTTPEGEEHFGRRLPIRRIYSIEDTKVTWFLCPHCGGWVRGLPKAYHVNTLNVAAGTGRQGWVENCCRCGREISFQGQTS